MITLKSRHEFNESIAKNGYSKRAFARKSGVSESTLIQISNGNQSPRPETARKIYDALQQNFDDIFVIESTEKQEVTK
ncbi:helix-turn-helix transcriptional regulator [Virgibacillus natechei]